MNNKKVALIIMDGWAKGNGTKSDAISNANTPFINSCYAKYPNSTLLTCGEHVGLPDGQMGNSEVGHTTIGAGTVVQTDLVRIGDAIEKGEFEKNPAFRSLFAHVKEHGSTLHVQGLIGAGGGCDLGLGLD